MDVSVLSRGGARSDQELVHLVRNGDPDAFSALSDRYMAAMHASAGRYARICGADVEDFLQDAMVALFRAAKGYNVDLGTQFSTYAISSINNAMTSALRRHLKGARRNAGVNIDDLDETQLQAQLPGGSHRRTVEDMFLDEEDSRLRALQIETLLSDFERRVLKLYLAGYPYRQVSEILLISTKAVDNALQRVRRKLRSA